MQMEMSTKVNGLMTRLMEKDATLIQTELSTMENGKLIDNMALVANSGPMVLVMKASSGMATKKEKEFFTSLMDLFTMVNSVRTKSTVTATTNGKTAKSMKVTGSLTR